MSLLIATILLKMNIASDPEMQCVQDSSYVNEYNQPSYFLSGVARSLYDNDRNDRIWKWIYCKPRGDPSPYLRQYTLVVTPYDIEWIRNCGGTSSHNVMVTGYSTYDNNRRDRKWWWSCGQLDTSKYLLYGCERSSWVNDFDAAFSYFCPSNGVITEIQSYHDNDREDRRWYFICCKIMNAPTPSPTPKPTPTPT
eukprot:802417_1